MRKTLCFVAAVLTLLGLASPAGAAHGPHIIDPSGDANWTSCAWIYLGSPCVPGNEPPPSQPVTDILAVDFSVGRQSLLIDMDVLDIDHPVIGAYGSGPEDGTTYSVSFAVSDNQRWAAVLVERDSAGAITKAFMQVYEPFGSSVTVERTIPATVDVRANRIGFVLPFETLNEALAESCPDCTPVGRGSVLWSPMAGSAIDDRDTLGTSSIGRDYTDAWGQPYTVGH